LNWMKKTVLLVAVFALGVVSGSMIWTSSANNSGLVDPNQPGSANDPLVTKSYVDEAVASKVQAEIAKQIDSQLAAKQKELDAQIEQFKKQLDALLGQAGGMVVVELQPNQTLFADPGTSLIVRNGKTVAVSTDANGIPDVTGGKDLMNGTPVELNHMLLFPREGRGIKSTHNTTVFVMVTGGYKILNADGTVASTSGG
jgi:hypothetical protein